MEVVDTMAKHERLTKQLSKMVFKMNKIMSMSLMIFGLSFAYNAHAGSSLIKSIKNTKQSIVRIECKDFNYRGTGFIVDKKGYIFTCNHVIANHDLKNAVLNYSSSITIKLNNGTELPAEIVISTSDLLPIGHDYAILKIGGGPYEPVTFSSNSAIEEGTEIFFSGFPLSVPKLTTHKGIISSIYHAKTPMGRGGQTIMQKIIQIDASVNQGNSGGPLFDTKSNQVLGIITMREGGISPQLESIRKVFKSVKSIKTRFRFRVQGVRYAKLLAALEELIGTLDKYISVGIGKAISIEYAKDHLNKIINTP